MAAAARYAEIIDRTIIVFISWHRERGLCNESKTISFEIKTLRTRDGRTGQKDDRHIDTSNVNIMNIAVLKRTRSLEWKNNL